MRRFGLDASDIKYVLISHAHGDHIGGAEMLQNRGQRILMDPRDWDLVEQFPNRYLTMAPKRDLEAEDGQLLTLGDTTITIWRRPGHTAGTRSYMFTVFDNGRPVNDCTCSPTTRRQRSSWRRPSRHHDGSVIWQQRFPGFSFAAPCVASDAVAISSADGTLRLLEPATGATQSEFSLGEGCACAPAMVSGALVVGTGSEPFLHGQALIGFTA
jgi:hypothetical protein